MLCRPLTFMLVVPTLLTAQPPAPACTAAEHRQFDFWVGDWTVTDSAGATTYGANRITREENGCALREQWRGASGVTGQSLNFYDPHRRQWEQLWVASGGTVLRLAGGFDGTSMTLEGESISSTGAAIHNRITWTPRSDGRVRQRWKVSEDGGTTWRTVFDGWYRRSTAEPAR